MTANLQESFDQVLEELERDKAAIGEIVASYRDFISKVNGLPPHLSGRVIQLLTRCGQAITDEQDDAAPGGESPASPSLPSLAGRTSLECARQILQDHGNQSLHFGAIAKEALERGYVGRPSDETDQAAREHRTAQSFWATMHRAPEVFDKEGNGFFKLRGTAAE